MANNNNESVKPVASVPVVIHDFQVTAQHHMRRLCALWLGDNWLWLVLPVAVCAILAVWVDVRFVIVALMTVLVAMPMVLALLYFYYGLAPAAHWSLMTKSAQIDAQGTTLTFADERMRQHTLPWNQVRDVMERQGDLILVMRSPRYAMLIIPDACLTPDARQAVIDCYRF